MDVFRVCKINEINWGALPEIKSRLEREGISVDSCSVSLKIFPDTITYSSLEDAANEAKNNNPKHYDISIQGRTSIGRRISCRVSRLRNIHDQECLYLHVNGVDEINTVNSIMEFFGLEPDEYSCFPEKPPKTAFIAHRFDNYGIECADKLARLLGLIGFEVITGRAYSPQSVALKVKERIEKQSVVFAIVTPGGDNTWLIQESILSEVKGKPLIILKETSVAYKPGILADHEYIPFDPSNIESSFIPILEGLREIGYFYD